MTEKSNQKTYHYVYKITNLINQKIYVGKHSTNNLDDDYMGSGKLLHRAYNKYDRKNFKKEILEYFDSEQEALNYERELVNQDFILREDTYNLALGGRSGWSGLVIVKDKNDNILQISKNDPRYLSGKLISVLKDKVTIKDKDGNTSSVSVNDPRILSGELVGITEGYMVAVNENGNTEYVSCEDLRLKIGELFGNRKGWMNSKDKDGNIIPIKTDDPRLETGELISDIAGTFLAKDKNGNIQRISINDPRRISGELVGVSKGKTSAIKSKTCITNGKVNKFIFIKTEEMPEGFWKGTKKEYQYIFTNPKGKTYKVSGKNITKFCKENKISQFPFYKNLGKIIKKAKNKNTIGWKMEKINANTFTQPY